LYFLTGMNSTPYYAISYYLLLIAVEAYK
jgi:hypothetical protein